jgi:hypothetical protein
MFKDFLGGSPYARKPLKEVKSMPEEEEEWEEEDWEEEEWEEEEW